MASDLVVPIYLDTNALLDLLASIEGGFNIVEKITTKESRAAGSAHEVKAEAGTEFGIPNVLSLLKLALGYSGRRSSEKAQESAKETERYYTYGSLFVRLRDYLSENDLLKVLDDGSTTWEALNPSDFVEVRGLFRPNPFATSLGVMDRLLGMSQLFVGMSRPKTASSAQSSGQGSASQDERRRQQEEKRLGEQAKEQARNQAKQMEEFRSLIKGVLSDIQNERIRTFVVEFGRPVSGKAVALLFLDYLRDQTMTEIANREYRMLGKIVRKIETGSTDRIDMLAGTGLGGIGRDAISQMAGAFSAMPGMNMPQIETEILGPALELVPVAVFI